MTETKQATKTEAVKALKTLKNFMSSNELAAIITTFSGEEKQHFFDKMVEMVGIVDGMAKTYEQDGKGMEATAYLHYFMGPMDWYITEKDMEQGPQLQAYGHADLGLGFPEVGYISIADLIKNQVELDLHFTPKTLREALKELEKSKKKPEDTPKESSGV